MNTREILIGARERIARGWAQGNFAYNAEGDRVGSSDPEACKWCVVGAIYATTDRPFLRQDAMSAVAVHSKTGALPIWNDAPERTQADVLAAFDRAIEAQS